MTRGTKRSTELQLFQMTGAGMTEIALPSATTRAFELLKATASYRCVFQRPLKWTDNETLVVRASGGIKNPAGDGFPQWYEVDVTFNIEQRKTTAASVVEVKPFRG